VAVPSMYSFLWRLYDVTKDPAFAQVVYHRNKNKLDGLPFDLSRKTRMRSSAT
jgi:hypothetical protein